VHVGQIAAIGCFPVKSMLGEAPARVAVDEIGVRGDRRFALVDAATGKVASAKDPRKWSGLLQFRARYVGGETDAALVIVLPDGSEVRSDDPDVDARLGAAVGRAVRLVGDSAGSVYDMVWEGDDIAPSEIIAGSQNDTTDDGRPVSTVPLGMDAPGTFQDVAPITVLTTGALRAMATLHREGDWHPARFRPNFLIETNGDEIAENDWVGRRLRIGEVAVEITALSPRCVMTTLAQPGLERDRSILRTVAANNRRDFAGLGLWACLGAYAKVLTPGAVAVGDDVTLE
jgi:uncharacterized protein YcbX